MSELHESCLRCKFSACQPEQLYTLSCISVRESTRVRGGCVSMRTCAHVQEHSVCVYGVRVCSPQLPACLLPPDVECALGTLVPFGVAFQ